MTVLIPFKWLLYLAVFVVLVSAAGTVAVLIYNALSPAPFW